MTDAASRRLLVVTYWYPPAVGAAAERMQSFAKYLPYHGWQVTVLTARHGDEATVYPPAVTAVADPWRRSHGAIADYYPASRPEFMSRVRSFLRERVFPDRFVRWQSAALAAAQTLVQSSPPDVILASFPPASAIELAMRIRDVTGLPLVLDYRDKWIGPGGYQPRRAAMLRRHMALEQRAIAASAAITAVSDALILDIQSTHGYRAERTAIIHNGFEPAAPSHVEVSSTARSSYRRTIAHVGTVIERNRPDVFFSTLREMMARFWGDDDRPSDPDPYEGFRFRFVGNLSARFLADTHLDDWVSTTGLVPRDVARTEMFNADALLLLTGNYVGQWGYSVKLFEYLQTGRPILCLEETPDSNDARLLRELAPERSFIGRLGDADSLSEQLIRLRTYLSNETRKSASDLPPGLARFSRANQAAELAKFLNTIVKS